MINALLVNVRKRAKCCHKYKIGVAVKWNKNKTDRHIITEILLKVVLSTILPANQTRPECCTMI